VEKRKAQVRLPEGRAGTSASDDQDDPRALSLSVDLLAGNWYSTEELAALLGVDPSSVRRWRTSRPPQGPPFVRLSARLTIYSASDIEAWLRSRRIDPGGRAA
jgi:predicted DNA-binding transcriptional regulator AlpA